MAQRIRSIKTFTSEEIIGMVDLLIEISKPVIENANLIEGGDMRYRKIEVKLLQGTTTIICKVAYAEQAKWEKTVLAFMIEESNEDIYILPINRSRYTKEFVDPIGITGDFAGIDQALRKVYMFFAEKLQLWNLGGVEFRANEQLTEDWYSVEEIVITDD